LKVLIITYYWPPSGGSGVQRWLQFVKYLRDFQIEPIVYTVENPNYALIDTSLQQEIPEGIEILKQPIWEPNDILSFFKSNKKQTSSGFLNPNPSFFEKILLQIRANYFIPDSRKYWVKPSVAYLYNYLKNNHIYAIITTGPPHSVHLIGLALKRKTGVKWISDFRDPWTDIDYFHQLPLSEKSREKHFLLEKEVLEKSDAVLVVGKTMKEKYAAFNQNVHVITNGFDGEINVSKNKQRDIFTITHIGLMNSDRNSVAFWEVLQELIVENNAFAEAISVQLIGKVAKEVKETISKYGLENVVKIIDYVPYNEVQKFQNEAQVLLLVVNNVPAAKGILTGKIFEYLQARRPILAIGPTDGDLAEIIQKTGSGVIVDYEDKKAIENCILSYFKNFKEGNLVSQGKNIEQYHRKNLTQQLSEVIKNL
jgi:hypothetical protein